MVEEGPFWTTVRRRYGLRLDGHWMNIRLRLDRDKIDTNSGVGKWDFRPERCRGETDGREIMVIAGWWDRDIENGQKGE